MRSALVLCPLALVPLLFASCGGEFSSSGFESGGSGGSSGTTTGGAGGTSGSQTGGSSGSGGSTGGSGGSIGGSGGSGGTSGVGGIGGEDRSCVTDTDCVLGYRAGLCCPDCKRGLSRAFVEEEPCYCASNEPCAFPSSCEQNDCGVGCPAIACAPVIGVKCATGVCTEIYEGMGGTGGGGAACEELAADYDAAVQQARKCSGAAFIECSGQTTVPDFCGCPVVLNDTSPASAEAQRAYSQWVQAGCDPVPCAAPCTAHTTGVCTGDVTTASFVCEWAL